MIPYLVFASGIGRRSSAYHLKSDDWFESHSFTRGLRRSVLIEPAVSISSGMQFEHLLNRKSDVKFKITKKTSSNSSMDGCKSWDMNGTSTTEVI